MNFIPNYILKKILDIETLQHDRTFRQMRKIASSIPVPAEHDEVRALYDAENRYTGGVLKQVDKQNHSTEPSTNSNLEIFNKIYDFCHDLLGRESFDNENAVVNIYEHVGEDYNNAFWDSERFAFGDGDQFYFKTFFTQNVATHEFFHAVTEYTTNLRYEGESGALNESISDVFAVCLDQKLANQKPTEATWIIGEGIFSDIVNAKGLRSFKKELAYDDPVIGTDPQPKHMNGYVHTTEDEGGVHINSGIPNHAFYRFCIRTGLNSWEDPMLVWYNALKISSSSTNFQEFAENTMQVVPDKLAVTLAVAWNDVGITVQAPEPIPEPTPEPTPVPSEENPIISFIRFIINLILGLFR